MNMMFDQNSHNQQQKLQNNAINFEQDMKLEQDIKLERSEFIPVSTLSEAEEWFGRSDRQDFDYYLVRSRKNDSLNFEAPRSNHESNHESKEDSFQASVPLAPPPFKKALPNAAQNEIENSDVPYLIQNADLLLKANEIHLARNIYRAILKTGEGNDVAYAGLAECSDREGLVEQALQFAWDSVAFAPNQRGYQILSQLLIQQGRDREAASALSRAMKLLNLSPQDKADYYKVIGNCYSRLGEFDDAEKSFKKALELSPTSDDAQSNLGSLYLEQGQIQNAKRCYQDAVASNTLNDKAWVGLGLCLTSEGRKAEAHEAFKNALERNLKNSTAIFHLVKCAYELKKYSEAEVILSKYVEIAPVSPSLLYSLAGLQFHVGKKQESKTTVNKILQIKPDHQGAQELVKRLEAN